MKSLLALFSALALSVITPLAHAQSASAYTFSCTSNSNGSVLTFPISALYFQNTTETLNFSMDTTIDNYLAIENSYYDDTNNYNCSILPANPVAISFQGVSFANIELNVVGGVPVVTPTFTAQIWSFGEGASSTKAKMKPTSPAEKRQALSDFLARLPKAGAAATTIPAPATKQ